MVTSHWIGMRVPSNAFNWPLIGSELDGRIGAIHIGSCRGSGRIDPDAEAHAHIDGSAEICIFQMPESRAQMEWLIAHETAHLIVARARGPTPRPSLAGAGRAPRIPRGR